MKLVDKISVFFPAYNEEKCLEKTVQKADKILQKIAGDYEIIIINDGSKDKTGEIADKLASQNKKIRAIHHFPNQGYGAALRSGFYNAKYSWIVTIDSDGQFDFTEIDRLLALKDQADVIIGYRMNRQDSFMRKIYGSVWTLLNNFLFGINVKDVDCSFKLVKKEVIERIPKLESVRGAMISPELLVKARKLGFRIKQVGVTHYPDVAGGSTGASIIVIFKSFSDLFKLWVKLH